MKATEFVTHLERVKPTSTGYVACCPAHDDARPSLSIRESEDRLLVHCWAGCQTSDVLGAMGMKFPDLFLDNAETNGRPYRNGPRQPEPLPRWYWDWRRQCGELERAIEAKRERHEAILAATRGLDINRLTGPEFDELMTYVGNAYRWLDLCARLDEMLFDLQQVLRAEEQAQRLQGRKGAP